MDAMQTLALVLLLVATVIGLATLAVGMAWMRRTASDRARRAARGRKSRSARRVADGADTPKARRAPEGPDAPSADVVGPAVTAIGAPGTAAAPAVMRTSIVDLPLLDDEPTQPMMHIDMAPASGWPNTMPASLATMAHQYAETQPAEMQKH